MFKAARPVRDRCYVVEMVVAFCLVRIFLDVFSKNTARNDRGLVYKVSTGAVKRYRIKGCREIDIRHKRNIVFGVAVAVR